MQNDPGQPLGMVRKACFIIRSNFTDYLIMTEQLKNTNEKGHIEQ